MKPLRVGDSLDSSADGVDPAPPLGLIASRLVRLVESSVLWLGLFDRRMCYLAASPVWLDGYGLDAPSLRGRSHYEVFPEIPARWVEVHRRALAGEHCRCDLDRFVRQDGSEQWLRWSVSPWHDESGEVGGVLIGGEDISERHRLESSLEDAETMLATLFESIAVGLAIVDSDGRFLRCNRAFEELVARTGEELKAMCHASLIHPDDLPRELEAIRALRRGQQRFHESRCRHLRRGHEPVWVEHLIAPLAIRRGRSDSLVICVRDIGERLAIEQRLRESDRLASIGMLGAGLGHDMRNVLFAMRCGLSSLQGGDRRTRNDSTGRDAILQIAEGLEYLGCLTDSLQTIVADPSGTPAERDECVCVGSWWNSSRHLLCKAVPRSVSIETRWEEPLPPARVGPAAFSQIMLNLISNAGQAIAAHADPQRRNGVVHLEARRAPDGGSIQLEVSDDGIGMSEEVRRRAFEPFFTTRVDQRGTGLGLAMVRRLVEEAGGSIEIDPLRSRGTRMLVQLPVAEHAIVDAAPSSTRRRGRSRSKS